MRIETSSALTSALAGLGLLDPEQLTEARSLADQFPLADDLARQLGSLGWLTPYQLGQVLPGNGERLLVGPYALQQRLGGGYRGELFLARHQRTRRLVALRVIR